jgi:hypothetical protein
MEKSRRRSTHELASALLTGPTAWKTWLWLVVVGLVGTMAAWAPEGRIAQASRHLWLLALYLVQAYLMAHMAETGFDGALAWSREVALPRLERMLFLPVRLFAASWVVGLGLLALVALLPNHVTAAVALLVFAAYFPAAACVATLYDLQTTVGEPLLTLRAIAAIRTRLPSLLFSTLGGFSVAWIVGGRSAALHPVGYGLSWALWLLAGLFAAKTWGTAFREEHEALGLVLPPDPEATTHASNHSPPPEA